MTEGQKLHTIKRLKEEIQCALDALDDVQTFTGVVGDRNPCDPEHWPYHLDRGPGREFGSDKKSNGTRERLARAYRILKEAKEL